MNRIRQSTTDELQRTNNQVNTIRQTPSDEFKQGVKIESEEHNQKLHIAIKTLSKFSFSHLVQKYKSFS